MNCLAFDRLLDDGDLTALSADALAHARGCVGCARALRAAQSLEQALQRALAAPAAAAQPALSTAFTDRVLAQVRTRGVRRGVRHGVRRGVRYVVPSERRVLPWWVEAFAQPASMLACGVLALVLWQGNAYLAAAQAQLGTGSAFAAGASLALGRADAWFAPVAFTYRNLVAQGWTGQFAASLVLLTLAAIAGRIAFRVSERLVEGVVGA